MKKIYALVAYINGADFKERILLFETEKDRDNKLKELINDAREQEYYVSNNYGDGTTYQFNYIGNNSNIILGCRTTYTWTKTELTLN